MRIVLSVTVLDEPPRSTEWLVDIITATSVSITVLTSLYETRVCGLHNAAENSGLIVRS